MWIFDEHTYEGTLSIGVLPGHTGRKVSFRLWRFSGRRNAGPTPRADVVAPDEEASQTRSPGYRTPVRSRTASSVRITASDPSSGTSGDSTAPARRHRITSAAS